MLVCRSQHKGRWDEEEDASELLDAGCWMWRFGFEQTTNGINPQD